MEIWDINLMSTHIYLDTYHILSDVSYLQTAFVLQILTLLLLNMTCLVLANSVDPDQLASEEANWSGSALFALSMWICINKLDQVIWLAENWK